jgi:hypothetical protein
MTRRIFRSLENTGQSRAESVIWTAFLREHQQHAKFAIGNADKMTVMSSGWVIIVPIVMSLSHGNT